jgi:hypothetical protein
MLPNSSIAVRDVTGFVPLDEVSDLVDELTLQGYLSAVLAAAICYDSCEYLSR